MESETGMVTNAEESRGIMEDHGPIFYLVGWLVVAYFSLYFVTMYIMPALFNTRPFHPFYGYGYYRKRRSAGVGNGDGDAHLVSKITKALENTMYGH